MQERCSSYIKPYLPYTDIHTDAVGGFSDAHAEDSLQVVFPRSLLALIPESKQPALIEALGQDPRPAYCDDPDRLFGFYYAGFDVRFTVANGIVTVQEIIRMN